MFILLLTLCLSHILVGAIALPTSSRETWCDNIVNSSTEGRSAWDIASSCLATIFACTWISVHPNIPAPDEDWRHDLWTRTKYMLWTILAPEVVLFWAMKQWHRARKFSKEYGDRGWTVIHAHFLQMGGFTLCEENEPKGTLTYITFVQHFNNFKIDSPPENTRTIMDRSKTDAFGKCIALGQLGWFVAQVIARLINRLAVADLELVTFAFCFFTGFLYFFWWYKPANVQTSITIHIGCNHGLRATTPSEGMAQSSDISKFTNAETSRPHISRKIGTFYALPIDAKSDDSNLIFSSAFIGMVFGSLHCLGLVPVITNGAHGSSNDGVQSISRGFWGTFSVAISVVPFIVAVVAILQIKNRHSNSRNLSTAAGLLTVFAFLALPFYAIARVGILSSAFISLTDGTLPTDSSVFNNTNMPSWLLSFPHFT